MTRQNKKKFGLEKWLGLLREGKGLYSSAELQLLTGLSTAALQRALARLNKADFLIHAGKGFYANGLRPPVLEEIASVLYPPAYISLESALFAHGVIQQAPHVVTGATLNKTKIFRTGLGEIFYCHLQPKLFFGYAVRDRVLLAEPEKAALDYIYLQKQNGFSPPLDEWNWENLDAPRLQTLAQEFPKTVAQHLGKFMMA